MIERIEFSKESKEGSYEFELPSIQGKTYEFKTGINVIVGENGCGKTSLFNVIRELTWCNKKIHSFYGETGDKYEMDRLAKRFIPFVTMRNDYSKSVFNLRDSTQIGNDNFEESVANFSQMFHSFRRSSGENIVDALGIVLYSFVHGNDNFDGRDGGVCDTRDFNKMVLDGIRKDAVISNDIWTEYYKSAIAYYEKNNVSNDCYTILMDEPDRGLDVHSVKYLYNILGGEKPLKYPLQIIAIVHNVALIARLSRDKRVNFIEMSDGYLDDVRKFVG